MTTNTTPSDPGPRVLHPDDPAELLAEARLCLREIPTDCLILVGHAGDGTAPMLTCSPLTDVMSPEGPEHLEHHLGLMREHGSSRALALLVIDDGYEPLAPQVAIDISILAGGLVLTTASRLLPEPFEIDVLWAVGDSSARQVLLSGAGQDGDESLLVSPPGPLKRFSETSAAANAVFSGDPVPQEREDEPVLEAIGRSITLARTELGASCDPGALFETARGALGRLRTGHGDPAGSDFVTDCEHVSALLSAVAVDRLHWELLAQCVEHGNAGSIDREELLQVLVSAPQWSPHPDICAGGSWYEALEKLREVAAAAMDAAPAARRSTPRAAWRGLTAMLVMLAWWNHRFATAGGFVDDLWGREPDSTLAPLLARMTDTPIFPAWWPST
ncbi:MULTISPECIES: hypothetical protein [unclassified Brachybacterium]|uniref:hypothetical protein n=1 Tax=unclassified Brachybacterium TaxID=2623841 RepID=UPI0036105180